jgi:dihydrofolate synthase/folylpolyglutamate synthase
LTFVPVDGHEHHDPANLAARYGGLARKSLESALTDLPGPRLIAGSLYLAGRALEINGELPN